MSAILRKLRMMGAVFTAYIRSVSHFRAKLIMDNIMIAFRAIMVFVIYQYVYAVAPQINSILPVQMALWSMGIHSIVASFALRSVYRSLSELVYTGNIETYLVRPLNMLLFMVGRLLGEKIISFIITAIVVLSLLITTVGIPSILFSFWNVLLLIMFLVLGLLIELLMGLLIGLMAIWLENSTPIFWIYTKLVLLFGGQLVPVAFFPPFLLHIAQFSPFGATRFSSYFFYNDFFSSIGLYLGIQIFWCVLLFGGVVLLNKKGQSNIFINGS